MQLVVSISEQTLGVYRNKQLLEEYSIATAKNGVGQLKNSECTPLGSHRIRAKIGDGQPSGTVFVGRRATGEIHSPELSEQYPDRDWILTRILWLCGNKVGQNRLGDVDTMQRYIYIHGAPEDHQMGEPSSHGCVKMRNADVIELFDLVDVGTNVDIIC